MAWSIVGVGTNVVVTATGITLIEPTGAAPGDLLVASISFRATSATSVTLPAGWTRVGEQKSGNTVVAAATSIANGCMAYIVRGAAAPSYAFTLPAASVGIGRVIAYRGHDPNVPFDLSSAATTATNITALSVAGLTTGAANELLVAMVGAGRTSTWTNFRATDPATGSGATDTTTAPSTTTWIERTDQTSTSGPDVGLAVFDAVKASAGATGNFLATATPSAGHAVIVGAFKPSTSVGVIHLLASTAFNSATSSATFSGLTYSAAAGDLVFAVIGNMNADNVPTISSVTIGGNATNVAATNNFMSAVNNSECNIYWLLSSGITNGNVVVTLSGTVTSMLSLDLYAVRGADTTSPLSGSAVTVANTAATISSSLTVPTAGAMIAGVSYSANATGPGTVTWTGATENSDRVIIFDTVIGSAASGVTAGAATRQAVLSVAPNNSGLTMVALKVPVSVTHYTLTATVGAAAVAGVSTTLRRSRVVTATTGAVAVTANTAALRRAYTLSATTGAVAVTGQAATLRAAHKVSATTAPVVVTGINATLTKTTATAAYELTAQVGAVAVSPQTATLRVAHKVSATTAAVTVLGQSATLRAVRKLIAQPGGIVVTGNAAVLSTAANKILLATSGAVTVSGQATALRVGRVLRATTSSILVTGYDADLDRLEITHHTMIAAPGVVTVSGPYTQLNAMQRERQPGPLYFGRRVTIPHRW